MPSLRRLLRPPGGTTTLLAVVFLAIPIVATVRHPEHWFQLRTAVTSLCALAGGIGIWFRRRWGLWLAGGLMLWLAGYFILGLFREFRWLDAGLATVLLFSAWSAFRERFPDQQGEEWEDSGSSLPVSFVALCRELPYLDADVLARAASRAFGRPVAGSDASGDATSDFAAGDSPLFVLNVDGRMLLVHHFDRPYFDDPDEAARGAWELRHQTAIREHRAWLSVDALGLDGDQESNPGPEVYAPLGRLLAELIDDSCLAILCPAQRSLFVCDAETESNLRSDDPLASLNEATQAPMISISDDDPRMQAAVREARSRWNEFAEAFASRDADASFYVKFPLREGDEVEFIWAEVEAIENDVIYGVLGNDPLYSRKKLGDRVQVRAGEINDWNYTDADGELIGGFTIRVLGEAAREQRKRRDEDATA